MNSNRLRSFLVGTLLAVAAACGGGDAQVEELAAACASTSNMGTEICNCVAAKAKAELSDDAFAMLLAMVNDEEDVVADLRERLTVEDAMEAGMFMTNAPASCAAEANSN